MKPRGYSPLSPAAARVSGNRHFVIHYLDDQFRRMTKDGHSLPIHAESPEQAVTFCFGMPQASKDAYVWVQLPEGGAE